MLSRFVAASLVVVPVCLGASPACRQVVQPEPPPAPRPLAELWREPPGPRDLAVGPGGPTLAPNTRGLFHVVEIKMSGFSDGYTLVDDQGREWSAKFPPEASTEVTASRILWAVGYHQPPNYLLSSWRATGALDPNPQRPARFREKAPDLHGMHASGTWSYADNPFVSSRPLRGLLVLHAMLGNSDLKDENNALYEFDEPVDGASRWYVARDLGQTFGRTGVLNAPRGDVEVFERTPFIRAVNGSTVTLDYRGRHRALFEQLSVDDVIWICRRLDRLTPRQWRDAFGAGGFAPPIADRFIRRMRAKIAEGLRLSSLQRSGS